MGSALETLCGQAYGAGQIRMLGVYMQRSWVILLTTACVLVPIYVWSPPILEAIGETDEISEAAGQCLLLCSYYIYMTITVIIKHATFFFRLLT
jgi:MATE family multidrug resistance protein